MNEPIRIQRHHDRILALETRVRELGDMLAGHQLALVHIDESWKLQLQMNELLRQRIDQAM